MIKLLKSDVVVQQTVAMSVECMQSTGHMLILYNSGVEGSNVCW